MQIYLTIAKQQQRVLFLLFLFYGNFYETQTTALKENKSQSNWMPRQCTVVTSECFVVPMFCRMCCNLFVPYFLLFKFQICNTFIDYEVKNVILF